MFENISDLRGYLEAIDVDDGIYVAFDATGRKVELTTAADGIHLDLPKIEQFDVAALLAALRGFVRDIGPSRMGIPDYETDSLESLILSLLPWCVTRP